jgi:hypothetical protein
VICHHGVAMDFYWNLWTEGGTSNRYDVSQINNIWYSVPGTGDELPYVPQIATLCCSKDSSGNPTSCVKHNRTSPTGCASGTYSFKVGKLWEADSGHGVTEGVKEDAQDLYFVGNPLKYSHFVNTGDATGVDH